MASNRGTPASGSENPAALVTPFTSSLYTTFHVGTTSKVPSSTRKAYDPLAEKTFQYAAIGAEKGVMFFEPISRLQTDTTGELVVDAIGFAGADNWRKGSIGISLAYIRSTFFAADAPTDPTGQVNDTGNGVRLNLGLRAPTGPMMWGLLVQNAGFIWWKDHSKTTLPLKIRVGNTWRIQSGVLTTIEYETSFYNEGSNKEDFMHLGAEVPMGEYISFRAGVFGDQIDDPRDRHYTAGFTLKTQAGAEVSYALEQFEISDEKVNKSYISVAFPFESTEKTK